MIKNYDNDISTLTARAAEMFRKSEYSPAVTDFMSPGEICKVYSELIVRIGNGVSKCFFWGGCRGAERRAAVFLPEWYMPAEIPAHVMPADEERCDMFAAILGENGELRQEIPLRAVRICGSGFKNLTHRDFMGGILSLGIDRSVIGDIAVLNEREAIVFAMEKIVPYITSELKKIGRDGVVAEEIPLSTDFVIPRRFEESVMVLSSLRLDGVVKALTNKSREAAADLVREGMVELSYMNTADVSAEVREGDVVSVRGLGKFIIGKVSGTTRSGKLRVECKKYI